MLNMEIGQKLVQYSTVVTIGSGYYFHTYRPSVLPSVRLSPLFKISQNKFSSDIVNSTGGTMGIAEEVIDDTTGLYKLIQPFRWHLSY